MNKTLHIAGGDIAGGLLAESGVGGEVFVWHDIMYDGPREPGWPDDDILDARARFIEEATGGGLGRAHVLDTLKNQYQRLSRSADYERIVLWFDALSQMADAPLPWIPAAVRCWLQEQPDPKTGLGLLETLALKAIQDGVETPGKIFARVAKADTPPQYWGDTTLWAKINALAERKPPLVKIKGPAARLPQWESEFDLKQFRIEPMK